jgi:hypothetical protein
MTTLDELFSRDPRDLTDDDLNTIIKILREQRTAWKIEASTTKRPKSAAKARAEAVGLAKGSAIDLKDIGL